MDQQIEAVAAWVRSHWNTIGLIGTWFGIVFVYWRKRNDWRRKQFLSQVNFSLNYVQDGYLVMRTLLETTATEVWLNDYGVKTVLSAAQATTEKQPFLLFKDPKDQAFVNRAVLNVLSEQFAAGYLRAAVGVPVKRAVFAFGITFERYADMRTLKLRVILAEQTVLAEKFAPNSDVKLQAEHEGYKDRWATLLALRELFLKDKENKNTILGRVELIVPTS